MYAGLDERRLVEISSDPSSAEYEADIGKLIYWGLEQGLIEGCDGFVLNPSDCVYAASNSLDALAVDYLDLEDAESTSQKEKLVWLRAFLKKELQGSSEDSPSFTVWPIRIGSVGFAICVVIAIEGHTPVAIDYFALGDTREIEHLLRDRGYLVTESDVEDLTDEQLLALWD